MELIPLSPVDYAFVGVGSQPVTFAFFYPQLGDPERLKRSLIETLGHFPLLNSRLQRISGTDLAFRIEAGGLTLHVHETERVFRRIDRIGRYIEPVRSGEGEPLSRITWTKTPAGVVLAISVSHALADGFSYFHFLSSWAKVSRGERFLEPSFSRPDWTVASASAVRTGSLGAEELYAACGLFCGDRRQPLGEADVIQERFFISADSIQSALDSARGEHPVSFTANDVLVAMLWKKYASKRLAGSEPAYMTCPVDVRRVLADMAKNYFGCALCFASAAADADSLLHAPMGDLALAVRNSILRVKSDFARNAFLTLDRYRRENGLAAMEAVHLRHPRQGLIVTNLTRMPIRDLDFGHGPPVDFLVYAEIPGGAALLPAAAGVEVIMVPPLGKEGRT